VTIGVVVADDQAIVRAGFLLLIDSEPDLTVLGEAADGAEAVAVTRKTTPDVVLMDIRMPVMDGIAATRLIAADASRSRVLILTTFDLDEYVFAALRAGASGFMLKDRPPEELLAAIRVIAAGEALLAPNVTRRLIGHFTRQPDPLHGATGNGVAGQAAALYDVSSTASNDMVRIIPVAVLAIAILLGLVLRSLVAPVYLVVTIAASYLAALGLTTFLVITIGGQDGLVFLLPFLMFVFLLALGEDYNILIMTRIREEARVLPLREAVVRAIGMTGPAVTSAGLILAGTFAVFAAAGGGVMGGQLQSIGLGLTLGVLLDTFGVRTLLVPSIVVLLGRWNWWPSRLGKPSGAERGEPAPVSSSG
jgi:DNA-binding NarL/FixJ family response regulator